MSSTALRRTRGPKHLCQRCCDRKARFRYRGVVRADRHHTLCFQCFRSERERVRAQGIREAAPALSGLFAAANRPPLTTAQREHRQAMLDRLRRQSSMAS